jgi:hypothetical protein
MIKYPIKDIAELNTILSDSKENHVVASILWLAQCTMLASTISPTFTTAGRIKTTLVAMLGLSD